MRITRRQFIKTSAMVGTGVVLGGPLLETILSSTKKAHPSSEYTYAFPHFVNDNKWSTGITILNHNSQKANLNLKAYNIYSDIIAEKDYILNPHASLTDKVENILDVEGTGDIIINSDKPLTGQETFTPLYGSYYGNMSSLLLNAENDTIIYFPHIASSDKWWTGLAFCNPNSLDALVRLTMIDDLGNEVGYNEVKVPPYSQAPAQLARDLFSDGSSLNTTGFVKAESDLPINGLEIFMGYPKGMAGLNAVLHKELSNTLYIPHFASGNYWWTGLGICNPNNEEAIVDFKAYSPEGNLNSEVQEIINPNAQMTPRVVRKLFPDLSVGEGWIKAVSNQPIAGLEVFGTPDGNIAGLNACTNPSKHLYFPKVVNGKNLYSEANPFAVTGLAFVNPNNEPANVNAKAYDTNGNLVNSKNIIVNPNESKPQMSYELAPDLKDGHIELNSDNNIIGLQIYIDKNSNISGTLAVRAVKEPAVGSLEDILIGGIIAGAKLTFYDRYKNYIDLDYTDSEGKFKIPGSAARLRIEKSGYYTRETNINSKQGFDIIPNWFDMNNFDTIFRGGVNEFHIQRWLTEKEGGQNPKWYIDKNTDQVDGYSSIPQSWIDRAVGTIEDKLTQLPIDIVKNPHIEIGYAPPIHYGGSSGNAPRPNEEWIWVKWGTLNPYMNGYHIEFGPNDLSLNFEAGKGVNIASAHIGLEPNALQHTYTHEFGQVLGARMNGPAGYDSAFAKYLDNYTTFDKNAFKICYERLCGNDDFEGMKDYDPEN